MSPIRSNDTAIDVLATLLCPSFKTAELDLAVPIYHHASQGENTEPCNIRASIDSTKASFYQLHSRLTSLIDGNIYRSPSTQRTAE